jgi:hypothetical protein
MGAVRIAACVLLVALALAPTARADRPPIKHVFVIVLENKNFDETFGPASEAPYLARTLTAKGQLLRQYYGTGHAPQPVRLLPRDHRRPGPLRRARRAAGAAPRRPGLRRHDAELRLHHPGPV